MKLKRFLEPKSYFMFLEYRSYYIEKLFEIVGTLTKRNFTG
ncbi:hypothetical protein LEP1GSC008_3114 [Leptospira kirschneri serovar Bulgarica str. Nikolaevo]|uniref:Uncharacterized protein n=1 Tax=Leptospira kirschneri serovar Bulgarica str. Nikolaevo TaxID=1240687 RepID=M6FQH5_9LEPT|nr:hypothetical protein LEP1GSC008_3114 [Leptospira kirschneri serovar Bulgarica str. Nikolaevo]